MSSGVSALKSRSAAHSEGAEGLHCYPSDLPEYDKHGITKIVTDFGAPNDECVQKRRQCLLPVESRRSAAWLVRNNNPQLEFTVLTRLQLRNFKSIDTNEPIELSELALLCGSNSSGKSSLIQAILMMGQTFASRYDFDATVLNGHLARLGSFRDILRHKSIEKDITVSFSIAVPPSALPGGAVRIDYECRIGSASLGEEDYHPVIIATSVAITREVSGETYHEKLSFSRPTSSPMKRHTSDAAMVDQIKVDHIDLAELGALRKEFPDLRVLACESNAFVPYSLVIDYDENQKTGEELIAAMSGKRSKVSLQDDDGNPIIVPGSFFRLLRSTIEEERRTANDAITASKELRLLGESLAREGRMTIAKFWKGLLDVQVALNAEIIPDASLVDGWDAAGWMDYVSKLDTKQRDALRNLIDKYRDPLQEAWIGSTKPRRKVATVLLRTLNHVSSYLTAYFSRSLKYLGPLRNEPQAVYASIGLSDPRNVGLKGEFTAAVLHINRHRTVNYPSPVRGPEHTITYESKRAYLQVACKDWLTYLGVLVDFDTKDKGKLGYEISVRVDSGDNLHDLTHVGVGVSQVLPIVLMTLLSDPGDLLIFEQPELHLHPMVQSRLCDFFAAMAMFGRQSIVETHSEYLINRLRLRIAQSKDSKLLDASSVFFVTKSKGKSDFSRVAINTFGAIPIWPTDFFDQTDAEIERILKVASVKRKLSKERRDAARDFDV